MTIHRRLFKSGFTIGSGQMVSQACSFLQNVIAARLLSPQSYGIAATFSMTFYLVDMFSNLGIGTHLIQAEDGNNPRFERTAQLLLALRGMINAAFIFVLAGPISSLFGVPQARWAFRCLALTPLLKSFGHLDTVRFQRELRFGPAVAVDVSSNLLVTLVALPLCWWLRDYTAMLWILVLQAAFSAIGAQIAAERRYGWAWDLGYARRMLAFGWPLLINGFLMYGIFQGDRFVIGAAKRLFAHSTYTLADLGIYSVAFTLTMVPTTLVGNVGTSLILPHLARVQKDRPQFERRYIVLNQIIALLAAMISIPYIVAGGWLVILVYGTKYAAAAGFIGWLGAMWALRTIRIAPTLAAMSMGDTRNSMISNVARTLALVGVLLAAATGQPITWIAISGFLGELLALAVCVGRLQREHGVRAMLCLKPFSFAATGMIIAGIVWAGGVAHLGWRLAFPVAAGLVLVQFLVMVSVFPDLRRNLRLLLFKPQEALAGEGVAS